jgi:hypothetical protein
MDLIEINGMDRFVLRFCLGGLIMVVGRLGLMGGLGMRGRMNVGGRSGYQFLLDIVNGQDASHGSRVTGKRETPVKRKGGMWDYVKRRGGLAYLISLKLPLWLNNSLGSILN